MAGYYAQGGDNNLRITLRASNFNIYFFTSNIIGVLHIDNYTRALCVPRIFARADWIDGSHKASENNITFSVKATYYPATSTTQDYATFDIIWSDVNAHQRYVLLAGAYSDNLFNGGILGITSFKS